MLGEWITGEDVGKEYGLAPIELGKACFHGELTAYCQAGWGIIYDASQLDRIPQYPPKGTDPLCHIQRGENVSWEWDTVTGLDKFQSQLIALKEKKEVLDSAWFETVCKVQVNIDRDTITTTHFETCPGPGPCQGLSVEELRSLLDNTTKEIEALQKNIITHKMRYIDDALYLVAEMNLQYNNIQIYEMHDEIYSYAWDVIMPSRYLYLLEGEIYRKNQLEERIFYFDFDMFLRQSRHRSFSIDQVAAIFNQRIWSIWFKRSSVETYCQRQSPPLTTGSNKDLARIQTTRQACETVQVGIEQEQHGFQVRGKYRTNQDHFRRAVESILGDVKPHRDTVREEWKKVREELKHPGRVPEQ